MDGATKGVITSFRGDRFLKNVFLGISVLILGLIVAGCGGGSNDKPLEPLIQGLANINSETLFPMVAVVRLDSSGEWVNAAAGSKLYPVPSGWGDVYFGVVAPPTPPAGKDSEKYMFAAYNNLSATDSSKPGDGKYRAINFLGSSNCYMQWIDDYKRWMIFELDGTPRWRDAYAEGGIDNVYIEAEYTRSRSGNTTDHRNSLDIMKALQKR